MSLTEHPHSSLYLQFDGGVSFIDSKPIIQVSQLTIEGLKKLLPLYDRDSHEGANNLTFFKTPEGWRQLGGDILRGQVLLYPASKNIVPSTDEVERFRVKVYSVLFSFNSSPRFSHEKLNQ